MADITKQSITLVNVGKLVVLVSGFMGLYYGLKMENQSLKDEIRLMVNDYKAEDRVINLRIEAGEKHDERQDNDFKFLVERLEGVLPEKPRRTRVR